MRTSVTADEARQIIREAITSLTTERAALSDSLGRVIATDIIASEDLPAFDNSSMDGFAVPLGSQRNQTTFRILGESAAGKPFAGRLNEGETVRIMTGARIPAGTDAVVELERVRETADTITVDESPLPGRNIRKAGEDIRKGATIMQAGSRLTPSHMGVLAAIGRSRVEVFRTPHVSVVTTGSELVPADQIPAHGQIRNSSAVMVPALLQQAHARVDSNITLEDDPQVLSHGLRKALSTDLLITTGGVSVGKYDLVLKTLESIGVEFLFWKVNIKPGMPLAFGRTSEGRPVFCLPGNPVSSAVTFLQFVRPALDALEGVRPTEQPRLRATLEGPIEKHDGKRHFSRGVVSWKDGRWTVRTTGSQSSGVLTSLVRANCLMIIPESDRTLAAGIEVEVELL